VSNASDASVDIVDVSDPTTPTLLERIDLSAHGTEVTSVAVGNGLVAATVEAGTPRTTSTTVATTRGPSRRQPPSVSSTVGPTASSASSASAASASST